MLFFSRVFMLLNLFNRNQSQHSAGYSNILLETFVLNLVSLTCPSIWILSKTQTGVISSLQIQSLIKGNWRNSRTSDDIDMKLGSVTKLYTRNETSNKVDNDVVLANCDVIVIFPIYGRCGAILKPDSRRIVCKTYITLNSSLLCYKN